jgi:putative hydrolase of the HAD superfamily
MTANKSYKHLFFDLDRTLWDFDTNSYEALEEMFSEFDLQQKGVQAFQNFHDRYKEINIGLWDEYRRGAIDRAFLSLHRFLNTLREFKIDDAELAEKMSQRYVDLVALKTKLFPDAIAVLTYLSNRYQLHVITNGFADVQYRKLENGGMRQFFNKVITSEEAGVHKPAPGIFEYAFRVTGANPGESLMIGDDPEVDMEGAARSGMDQLFVNHDHMLVRTHFTYEVKCLREIMDIL